MEQSGHEQVARHQTLSADCSSATITDLEPGVSYKFIVEAVTSVKTPLDVAASDSAVNDRRTTTVMSKSIIARTRAPCEAPRPIITGFTPTTVRLHWQRPLLEVVAGHRHDDVGAERHIRLSLEGYRLDINGQPHMRLSPATHECTLIKCRPGKTYSITLVALTCTENAKKARSKKVNALIPWMCPCFEIRDYRCALEMSENVFSSHFLPFPTVHSHFHSRSQDQPSFIPIPSQSHQLFSFPPSARPILVSSSSHLLLFFMDIMKQIASKLTTNGSLFVSETTENQIKMQNCLKLGHFSNTGMLVSPPVSFFFFSCINICVVFCSGDHF